MNSDGTVVVVGGSGAVGSLFVNLLRRDEVGVEIVDVAANPDADITAPDLALRSLLGRASTVILAVPETVALGADLTAMSSDALLVETLSVKSRFAHYIARSETDMAALGINPMFAPSLGMSGRPVAAVVHRPGPVVDEFLARITRWGGRLVQVDAYRHDRLAAATQALTHAAVITFGMALAELDLPIEALDAIAPPPHATALGLLARVTGGEPEVYWDVQAGNPYAAEARAALVRAASELQNAVDTGSEERFIALLKQGESALGVRAAHFRDLCGDIFGIVRTSGSNTGGDGDTGGNDTGGDDEQRGE